VSATGSASNGTGQSGRGIALSLGLGGRGFGARIAGPLACLALLVYGAVSLTKPHYSYFFEFSFSGETQGRLEAGLRLDDGLLLAPVSVARSDRTLHVVALPVRTVRGIQLAVGQNAGVGVIARFC
jgi:hypothetical protein